MIDFLLKKGFLKPHHITELKMKLAFGSDHAGFCFRQELAKRAAEKGYDVAEFGAASTEPYDYPDASDAIAAELLQGRAAYGILVCGSGIGVDIRANRYRHIRAANCVTPEMARLSREHNHANVLCLGERLITLDQAEEILNTFLNTEESQVPRHVHRVEKLDKDVK